MQWTWEPAGGVMNRLPELGLGWPESAHGWTGTRCRAASLDCSEWSGESDAGLARLDRAEG